jgi:hypothetical protein
MMEALGYVVTKLQRVAFANLTFHGLRVGDARELTQNELNELRDLVGLDHGAIARGRWRVKREDTDLTRRAKGKIEEEREAEAVRKLPAEERAQVARGPAPAPRPARGPERRPDRRTPREEARPRGHSKRAGQGRKARGPGKRRS